MLRGRATESGEEPLRYVQFAQWQNDLIEGDDENSVKGKEFWESIGEAPGLTLPNELKGSEGRSERVVARTLDAKLASQIETLAKRLNASESELLLAAWQCVLWRLTHQSSFRVGVVFDGREYDELREAVGLIAKCLPIEARFDGDFHFQRRCGACSRLDGEGCRMAGILCSGIWIWRRCASVLRMVARKL